MTKVHYTIRGNIKMDELKVGQAFERPTIKKWGMIMEEKEQVGGVILYNQSAENMSVVERLARDKNVDVEKLQRIMDMQTNQLDREAEQRFNADMVLCQSEIKAVGNNQENRQTNSEYADLKAVLAEATPVYTKNGFALSFYEGVTDLEKHVRVMVDIMHRDGHSKTRFKDLPIDAAGIKGSVNKTQIHANKSTFTYGQRILTCLIFNIPTGKDDDGNASGGRQAQSITEKQAHEITDLLIAIYGNDHSLFLSHINCNGVKDIPAKDFDVHKSALSDMVEKRCQ